MQLFTGGDATSYSSGFPSRLIYNMTYPTGPYTRLIPEMNFACNGNVTGYTVALRNQALLGDGQDPIILVWRKNTSQLGSYYKINPGIAIDSALCVGGLTEEFSGVFHCNLNQTRASVAVKAGDILGFAGINGDIAFARASRGPTNYVFNTSKSQLSMYSRTLLRPGIRELPQITLEIGSGKIYKLL